MNERRKVVKELLIGMTAEILLLALCYSPVISSDVITDSISVSGNSVIQEELLKESFEDETLEEELPKNEILEEESFEDETLEEELPEDEMLEEELPEEELPKFIVQDIDIKTMYATTSLNVRYEPYTDADRLGVLSVNEQISVTGLADTGWYRLEYNGDTAYVSGKYLSETPVEVTAPVQNQTVGIVETIGTVDSIWVTKAESMLSKLPQNALDRFVSTGYHFYVTDEDIGTTEFGGRIGRVAGCTVYGQYIKVEDRQYAMDEAVIHEFGHFVFDTCGDWGRQDVTDAFDNDVKNASAMDITYGLDNVSEFYAEVFQKYIKNPEKTSQTFPNLAAVIQADLDSL